MYKILILDDDPGRHEVFKRAFQSNENFQYELTHAYTVEEAITALVACKYDVVWLDHDLGGQQMVASGPGTGAEVAEWLATHPESYPAVVYVHSWNSIGTDEICRILPKAIKARFNSHWGD